MSQEELLWLGMEAMQRRMILEIGCYKGRSTAMLANCTAGKLTVIDNFYGEDDVPGVHGQDLMDAFKANLSDEIHSGKLTLIVGDSAEVMADFANYGLQFDMIFIDGGHDLVSVRKDCQLARQIVAPGGLICGHDWGVGEVKPAAMSSFTMAAPVGAGSIWKVMMP